MLGALAELLAGALAAPLELEPEDEPPLPQAASPVSATPAVKATTIRLICMDLPFSFLFLSWSR